MRRDVRALLLDITGAASEVAAFTQGMSLGGYTANAMVRRAVERDLFIVGESIVRLRRDFPEVAAKVRFPERIVGTP